MRAELLADERREMWLCPQKKRKENSSRARSCRCAPLVAIRELEDETDFKPPFGTRVTYVEDLPESVINNDMNVVQLAAHPGLDGAAPYYHRCAVFAYCTNSTLDPLMRC
eukprot:gene12930-biopygen4215